MRVALRKLLTELRRTVAYQRELGVEWYEFPLPSLTIPVPLAPKAAVGAKAGDGEPRRLCPVVTSPPRQGLDELRRELADCRRCPSAAGPPLFGVGGAGADLMVVAGQPSPMELKERTVFTGEGFKLFEKMMGPKAMNLPLERIFRCHLQKCGGCGEQADTAAERAWCLHFLHRQIIAVQPAAILVFGVEAAQALLASDQPLFRLRGRIHHFCSIPLVASYHPDFLLEHAELKKMAWQDLQLLQGRLTHELRGRN
ncbi:MAG: uracil-DNA glycosylase [Thermodesulfobacteriota bacterium]